MKLFCFFVVKKFSYPFTIWIELTERLRVMLIKSDVILKQRVYELLYAAEFSHIQFVLAW